MSKYTLFSLHIIVGYMNMEYSDVRLLQTRNTKDKWRLTSRESRLPKAQNCSAGLARRSPMPRAKPQWSTMLRQLTYRPQLPATTAIRPLKQEAT